MVHGKRYIPWIFFIGNNCAKSMLTGFKPLKLEGSLQMYCLFHFLYFSTMYEPVFSGSHTNMGGTGTPAIPDSNSLNYSAASSTASQEHKTLFAAYSRTPAQRNTYSGSGKGKGIGKRVPTCTLKFFCLSLTDASKPPTAVRDRTILINAGLGDASIQFKTDASSVECHQEIVSRFPKLLETDYELLL